MFNTNTSYVEYSVNQGQTDFNFLFKVYYDTDLDVLYRKYNAPAGTPATKLVLGVDYTVNVNGDIGGVVILSITTEANDTITLERNLDIDRLIDYQTNGDLLAGTLNTDQNYQTYLIQDLTGEQRKFIKVPDGVPGFDGTLPYPFPDTYIRWNDTGTALINDVTPPAWRVETERLKWEAEAWKKTSGSYATEPEDVFVKIYTSNGDGTFSFTNTTDYSAFHWATKAITAMADKVDKVGDTMTGQLKGISPLNNADLTRKDYVDSADTVLQQDINTRLTNTNYATATVGGVLKARLSGTALYLTNDGTDA